MWGGELFQRTDFKVGAEKWPERERLPGDWGGGCWVRVEARVIGRALRVGRGWGADEMMWVAGGDLQGALWNWVKRFPTVLVNRAEQAEIWACVHLGSKGRVLPAGWERGRRLA